MARDLEKTLSTLGDEELGAVAGGTFDLTFAPVITPVYASADHGGMASAFIGNDNAVQQTYSKQKLNVALDTLTGNVLGIPLLSPA